MQLLQKKEKKNKLNITVLLQLRNNATSILTYILQASSCFSIYVTPTCTFFISRLLYQKITHPSFCKIQIQNKILDFSNPPITIFENHPKSIFFTSVHENKKSYAKEKLVFQTSFSRKKKKHAIPRFTYNPFSCN